MEKREFKIEPRIKPLVDVLNKVDYIKTFSSCEGHYSDENSYGMDKREYAEVMFNVQDEKKFEGLARLILEKTVYDWPDAITDINKRYYVVPGNSSLNYNWRVTITPFKENGSNDKKRQITDKFIQRITSIVENYVKTEKVNSLP